MPHSPQILEMGDAVSTQRRDFLLRMAKSYIWWKSPEEAIESPARIIAQVMEKGSLLDFLEAEALLGPDNMAEVLLRSDPGVLSPRSWSYWHFRLGITPAGGSVPPVPSKIIPSKRPHVLALP